ncbi:tyrosine-type recombinase/integrase [Bremerella sp. JC817]|uniref:tyrosine-type recombinase/integrase n=1 Tax=Bremerella sp. JC817 TaxID=3231756 RepID=UPI003458F3B1
MNHLRAKGRASRTLDKYQFCFDLLEKIAKDRGVKKVSDVDLNLIDAFRADRIAGNTAEKRKPAAPKTITNDIVSIKQLVNFCVKRKLIRENPLSDLEIRKPPRTIQPVWSRDEVQAILNKARSPFLEPLIFYADSGARFGEGRWLTWKDVDLEKGVVHIQPKQGWKPKTGEQRVFHMSERMKEMFGQMPKKYRWVFTAKPTARYPEKGRQISERTLLTYLRRIPDELGLEGHLHTFKHSFVTHALIDLKVPREVIRRSVGTLDDRVLDYYVHVHDQEAQNMMKLVSGTYRKTTEDNDPLK